MKQNRIYLDHAATTPLDPDIFEKMAPYLQSEFGNPSAIYTEGRNSRKAVEEAREKVAKSLHVLPEEIFFTSGGSESDNWAIKGTAFARRESGRHIITTAIEHPAVLNTCRFLESIGYDVTYLPVDQYGRVSEQSLKEAIRDDTILISIMMANNEIGTLEPIKSLTKIAHEHHIPFHTDAVQAFGNIPIDISELDVDFLSLSGHKFYGPKGTGVLYCRKGQRIVPLIHGGKQERNLRGGTENIAGIVGIGEACRRAAEQLENRTEHERELTEYLINQLSMIPGIHLTGHPHLRLPGNASFCFDHIHSEALMTALDLEGIDVSGGSACTAGSINPSHVLKAIGLSDDKARNALRLTVGKENTLDEMQSVVAAIQSIIKRLN
ncbi:cysteine desulfurase family protein [Pseudoramibacter sp.]|jgi:cysteine desulfurase|uniref:cysteine desulfurase family protein n=1 Tax=Pseudoramibacter sp. TaxID=2034862 RepID=UPI0025D347A2|nr:cysteine desulfurase family protein [Pseudoramibacter sp.]MCH4072748.1 cysteine desulfurase [Pseudoramibacter sp.]MCH4106519.1 cysteine desulfurase [Pseudoramibacter sp.]